MPSKIDNMACAACGCICEDLSVSVEGNCIVGVEGACSLCQEYLLGQSALEPTGFDLIRTAEVLSSARSPLIYGLKQSTVETQRAAVALADALGATLDLAVPAFQRDAIVAMQTTGMATCMLGEIRQRADVVVFWGVDPSKSHPRFMERFLPPAGKFFTGPRRTISIGTNPIASADDHILSEDHFATLTMLRALAAGVPVSETCVKKTVFSQLQSLAATLESANYSAILFGPEIGGAAEMEALFQWVRQLNGTSRSAAMALGGVGIDNVLTWQTGYPLGVNFALGYPRYEPYAYSASALLESGQVDAAVIVGNDSLDEISSAAKKNLQAIPAIILDSAEPKPIGDLSYAVRIAAPGVHCGGTVFRMDGVPIKLKPIFSSSLPTAAEILSSIREGVQTQCA